MIELLQTILAFIVALAILIAVHEYGHFWVARRLGVKVLKFSIGFGQKLWSWRSRDGETEYMLAAVPLGGYVKMLDEREGDVADDEKHRAFNRQPVGTRIAIVVAGPLFNFFFAILAYWLMFMLGVTNLAGLPTPLLIELFLLNGIVGFVAGAQYIRTGLVAAIGVHFWTDIVWHAVWPLLYELRQ